MKRQRPRGQRGRGPQPEPPRDPALLPAAWPLRASPAAGLPATLPGGAPWPRISIVTPSFNQGAFIEETLLSVARQGYPNVEHLVIDGGSTDETAAVVARHREQLAYFVSEPDRGQSHAINKGFARATGEILTWLNSDDLLAPGALAAMALAFHTSGADLVAGVASLFADGRFVEHHLTSCDDGPLPLADLLDLDGGWNAGQFFYQPEVMFTRAIWERAGGALREDLVYSMDYDLWVRFAELGARLHVVGRPVAWFRLHANQKTRVAERFKSELVAYREQYQRTRGGGPATSGETPPSRDAAGAASSPRTRLRVAFLNDHGFHYGAGLAHQRLAEAMAAAGHEVHAVALATPDEMLRPEAIPNALEIHKAVAALAPDLVVVGNLHAAGVRPLDLGAVFAAFPSLVVLHDLWWLTGRCAYPEGCALHLTGCDETCPTAEEYPVLPRERIAGAWKEKHELLAHATAPILLGNSRWTAELAHRTLAAWSVPGREARVGRIQLSFPLDSFRPRDRRAARRRLGLPEERFIVLLTGNLYDRRKRTGEALEALATLDIPDLTVVALGPPRPRERFPVADVRRPGFVDDPERLALYYAAADLFVSPSLDETFGQTYVEAAASGTPSIGYRRTGIAEAVAPGISGELVDEASPAALAAAIGALYRDPERRRELGAWGRLHVENEWSPYAAYRRLFVELRRLGLADRLGMAPKIGFTARPEPLHEVQRLRSAREPERVRHTWRGDRIDFREPGRPSFVARFVGLSFREEWGRWTDGPRCEIHFVRPLPRRFRLELDAGAFAENVDHPVRVSVGEASAEIRIGIDPTLYPSLAPGPDGKVPKARLPTHSVELETSGEERVLAFDIPRPMAPALVWPDTSSDWRSLGLALQALRIRKVGGWRWRPRPGG